MRAFIVTTFLALPLAAWANLAPLAQPTDSDLATLGIHDIRRAILSDEPAARWEHAFLSGNGDTGAMAFGQAQMGAVAASLRRADLAYENVGLNNVCGLCDVIIDSGNQNVRAEFTRRR
jgi:hypothetical protein